MRFPYPGHISMILSAYNEKNAQNLGGSFEIEACQHVGSILDTPYKTPCISHMVEVITAHPVQVETQSQQLSGMVRNFSQLQTVSELEAIL